MPRPLADRLSSVTPGVALGAACVIAAASHLVFILLFGKTGPHANIWEYGEEARCALTHGGDLCQTYWNGWPGVYPTAYMPPLLSYVWLLLLKLFGDDAIARGAFLAINYGLSVGGVALAFMLARRLGLSVLAAFLSAMILALYPTFLFVQTTYHQTETAVVLLLALCVLAAGVLQAPRVSIGSAIALGVVSALATLNRTEMLVIGPVVILMVSAWRRSAKTLVAAGLVMALVMAPWVARNWLVFHKLIPVAQSSGYNLWKGYNPYTNGSGNMTEAPGSPGQAALMRIYSATPPGPNFETRLQANYSSALKADVQHAGPARLVQLTATKVALLWLFDWTDRDITHRPIYWAPWLVANALALLGLVRLIREGEFDLRVAAVCVATLALLTAAYGLTSVHARYRMHIEPFLFLLAGAGAEILVLRLLPGLRPTGRIVQPPQAA
jgi:hypothetical protein